MQERIVRYTSEELKAMRHLSLSNWEKGKNITDDDIDFSDLPELTDEQLATARWPIQEQKEKEEKEKMQKIAANKDSISEILEPKTVEKIKRHKSWKSMLKKEIEKLVASGVF